MFTENFERLVADLQHYGFQVRLIGGAVRDLLRKRPPRDLDMACDAFPDEVVYVVRKHGFDYDLKGLKHGTVKVIFDHNKEEYEITALDFAIQETGNKLNVKFGRDWRQDAMRRDFTVNAMSVDLEGNLYDYCGGLADLEDQHVRFIGDYPTKLENDPVIMLRFFKLLSSFPEPQFDKSALVFINQHKEWLQSIKPKRVHRELQNIAEGPNSKGVTALMHKMGLENYLKIAEQLDFDENPLHEHSFARSGDKTKDLWGSINQRDFAEWVCANILHDEEDQAICRNNPAEYSDYLWKYLADRVQYVAPANYGLQI